MENNSNILCRIYEMVRHGRSVELDAYLHKISNPVEIMTTRFKQDEEYMNLLMVAALNGHDNVVRLILSYSSDTQESVEFEGNVYCVSGYLVHNVTPLFCALDRAHYTVAHTLINLGKANVNHCIQRPQFFHLSIYDIDYHSSDPLLIDAVTMDRLDSVQFLVENGYADVNRTVTDDSYARSSLLQAAIKGHTEIVAYLISRGADIDYTDQVNQNTPLASAAMSGQFASLRVLCLAGASVNVRNAYGKTPLVLASKLGNLDSIDLLLRYTHDEAAFDDIELVAASHMTSSFGNLDERSRFMMRLLQLSFQRRIDFNVPKAVCSPLAAYDFHRECQTIDELNQITNNNDRVYIEAILIQERILVPRMDKRLFESLKYRENKLSENNQFIRCLHGLFHTFHLRQQMECRTCLHRFIRIFCCMLTNEVPIPVDQFLQACYLIFEPSLRNEKREFVMRNVLDLVIIATKVLQQPTVNHRDRCLIVQWIRDICHQERVTKSGRTLLHMSVDIRPSEILVYRITDVVPVLVYPNLAATKLLIECGSKLIDLNAIDRTRGETPLHVISRNENLDNSADNLAIAELLINSGAHIDCININGKTAWDEAIDVNIMNLLQSKQRPLRLKCLCARLITHQRLAYDRIWSKQTALHTFLRLHGGLHTEYSIVDDSSDSLYSEFCESDDEVSHMEEVD